MVWIDSISYECFHLSISLNIRVRAIPRPDLDRLKIDKILTWMANEWMGAETDWPTDRQTDRKADRQTDTVITIAIVMSGVLKGS